MKDQVMRIVRYLPWILLPVLCGVIVFGWQSARVRRTWASWAGTAPVINYPSVIDLREQERGKIVVTRFTIVNQGGADLLIDDVRTNCACSGLEREIDGGFFRVESLRLGSGEQADLAMRIAVRGEPGSLMRNVVQFRTNDPTQPEARIEAVISTVTVGVEAFPASLIFGRIVVGTDAKQVLELRDQAALPRFVKKVESSDPARFSVRLLTSGTGESTEERNASGRLVGRVEVELRTTVPGVVEGNVFVFLDDLHRAPDSFPISARIVPAVEVSPSSLALPRSSDSGPVYHAKCYCRSNSGKPLRVVADNVPAHLNVQVLHDEDDACLATVRIEWKQREAADGSGAGPGAVRLRVKAGDEELSIEILVTCRSQGGA